MKKLIGIFFLFAVLNIQAQYVRPEAGPSDKGKNPQPNSFGQNFSIGGSFGLQFGTYTYIDLEPLLNYHFNKSFMIGVGPIYQFLSVQDQGYGNYTSSTYGARFVALYFLPQDLQRFFIMGEFDALNVPEPSLYTYQILRGTITLPMIGIGYKEPISDKFFFFISGLWNFNNSPYNPYSNPVINAGFDIGLWH